MVLPIIVPSWALELPIWSEGALERSAQPFQDKLVEPARIARPCQPNPGAVRQPSEREVLIASWRAIIRLPPVKTIGCRTLPEYTPVKTAPSLTGGKINLLQTCEWLLRRQLRQDWAQLPGAGRAQVLTWITQVSRDAPVVRATALAADAAAWTLFAMYWCGTSHPAALFNRSLHPPTGLVPWISQFHIDQQAQKAREIQGEFVHYMGSARAQCDVLVRRMLKRTGRLAFMRELCSF